MACASSGAARSNDSPARRYANTYRLDPADGRRFNSERAESELRRALTAHLPAQAHYDPAACQLAAQAASAQVRHALRHAQLDRYKILCLVTIGERKNQDTCAALRFLWDAERDGFATYYFENNYLYAAGLVFGVYHE